MKIVLAVDGSESAKRAIEWVADHAPALGAEVVAVHAIEEPAYFAAPFAYYPIPELTPEARAAIRDLMTNDWCLPLTKAGVPHRSELRDGVPAQVVIEIADEEDGDLVVSGRRGRGGFTELVLGSTSHQLAHHLKRPLLIIP